MEIDDVYITFYLTAQYSSQLHQQHLESGATSGPQMALTSAHLFCPKALEKLNDVSIQAVNMSFDMNNIGLPDDGTNRIVQNMVVVCGSKPALSFSATIATSGASQEISIENGVFLSKNTYEENIDPSLTLLENLIGEKAEQVFTLHIDKTKHPNVDFSTVNNILLSIEYSIQE